MTPRAGGKVPALFSGGTPSAPPPATGAGGGWLERLQSVTKLAGVSSAPASVEDMQRESDAAARVQREVRPENAGGLGSITGRGVTTTSNQAGL